MIEILILLVSVCVLVLLLWRFWRDSQADKNLLILQQLEEKHRAMLLDFNDGLNKLGDRLSAASLEMNDRLRLSVAAELQATRDAMQALQLAQNNSLAQTRETVLEKLHNTLAEQGKAQQELIQATMRNATLQLTASIESLTKAVDNRLEQIGGKVSERLDEGFKKTN